MPSNWLAIDTNFPTFTGEEPVEEQIRGLVNYLYQLRESLQYSLQNLSKDNFNAAALENLTEEAKGEIGKQLQQMANELSRLSGEVETLKGRVSGIDALSGRIKTNEEDITSLQGRMAATEGDLVALGTWSAEQEKLTGEMEERVANAEGELAGHQTAIDNTDQRVAAMNDLVESLDTAVAELLSVLSVGENGSATLGSEGKDLHLYGNVYINGILFEQGGSA